MYVEVWSRSRLRIAMLGRRGAQQFSLAVLDQGATSFSSLALQVALVSLLAPHEFGSYAVAASIQGIAYLTLYAILLEPVSVIGAQQLPEEEHDYLVRALAALVVASLCAGAALAVAALICSFFHVPLAYAIVGGMLGLPGITLGWFARRVAYLRSRIGLALVTGGIASALLLIGVVTLYRTDTLSAGTGLALLGLASGAAALWPLRAMGIGAADTGRSILDGSWLTILHEHRPLARWGLLNAFSVYASRDFYAPLLAIAGGLEIAAIHRAATILALPILKLGGIVAMFLQPLVSRAAMGWALQEIATTLRWIFGLAAALAAVAALLLWPIVPPLVHFIFRDPIYSENTFYFYVVALTSVAFALIDASVNVVLRALRRFDLIFWPAFALGLVAGVFGLVGVWLAGLAGAAAALAGSAIVFVPATVIACVSLVRPGRRPR